MKRIRSEPKLRLSKQGVRPGLRLEYEGRRRRRRRLLIEPHEQLLVRLNDSRKLKKRPKRVRGMGSRLLS
jgi:exopolyphosphatase/pppGpp-phosphohydrolase